MFRTFNVFLYGINRLVFYMPYYNKIEKLINEGKIKEAEDILVKKLIKTSIGNVVKKSGLEIDIKGEENIPKEGSFMMIANHEGDFDAVALLYAVKERRFGTIAKKETKIIELSELERYNELSPNLPCSTMCLISDAV